MNGKTGQGTELNINVIREPGCVPMSPRMREVCWDFGIPPREAPTVVVEGLSLRLAPGSLILLTGPSGSGKSSILAAIQERVGDVACVGSGRFPTDRAVVDLIAPRKPLATALEILTACGLGEPRLWVRRFDDLSDGERFRARLARTIGGSMSGGARRPILCDEFTAILHRRLAKAVAYNLRKLVTRAGLTLIVATTHDDVIPDLQPDIIVRLGGPSPGIVETAPRPRPMTLNRRATIEPGTVRDYARFGPMHYRHRDGLGFVDKVFLLKESAGGDPMGILVFAHAPMELAQRNRSTDGRFKRNLRRLNRELRLLRRLVMHPDVRGCGLGHWFVRETLPKVGVRFVECLAAMGAVNPVFEKAGMVRVGRCPLPRGRLALLERMRKWDVDPFAADFPKRLARCPRVRTMVEQTIRQWVEATQGAMKYRVAGRPATELAQAFRQLLGRPPIYYLWDRQSVYPTVTGDADTPASKPRARGRATSADTAGVRRRPRDRAARHDPDAPPARTIRRRTSAKHRPSRQ